MVIIARLENIYNKLKLLFKDSIMANCTLSIVHAEEVYHVKNTNTYIGKIIIHLKCVYVCMYVFVY